MGDAQRDDVGTDASAAEGEGWVPEPGVGEPDDELELRDLDTMLEATHPMRGNILRRLKQPHTVAEIAEAMGVPVTRLYHHINRLVDAGLIRVVATRQVAAVTERRYQVVARSFNLHDDVFATRDRAQLAKALCSVFDLAKLGFQRMVESGTYEDRPDRGHEHSALSLGRFHLTDERRAELMTRLVALFDEFQSDADAEGPDTTPITLFIAAFPEP